MKRRDIFKTLAAGITALVAGKSLAKESSLWGNITISDELMVNSSLEFNVIREAIRFIQDHKAVIISNLQKHFNELSFSLDDYSKDEIKELIDMFSSWNESDDWYGNSYICETNAHVLIPFYGGPDCVFSFLKYDPAINRFTEIEYGHSKIDIKDLPEFDLNNWE
jgi:hypothetical protein